jgi:two-component system NtrC family response regulator
VRELRNAIERAAVIARGESVTAADLSFIADARSLDSPSLDWPDEDIPSAIERLEKMLIRRALVRNGGNRAEAARALGIHRQLLYAKMKRYALNVSADRTDTVGEADGGAAAPSK